MSISAANWPMSIPTKRIARRGNSCASASRRSTRSTRASIRPSRSAALKHWAHEVDLEESVAASQLTRLRDDLREVLPELGLEEMLRADGTVIDLGKQGRRMSAAAFSGLTGPALGA